MVVPQRRGRLITIQELLEIQRESVPTRCSHCQRDATDRDKVEAALRARIGALEARLGELERRSREDQDDQRAREALACSAHR